MFTSPLRILILLAVFSTSYDIFLVLNLGGFNFRLCQLAMLLPMAIYVLYFLERIIFQKSITVPKFEIFLLLWVSLMMLFVPNSINLKNGTGYALWLCFNILTILTVVKFFSDKNTDLLIKFYLFSFVFMSIIGLIQFFLGLVDINFYATQRGFISGYRINGFSYEPSYYSTYMLIGWILFAYLREVKCYLFSRRKFNFCFILISSAMIFSTSRMGILMMFLWLFLRFFIKHSMVVKIRIIFFLSIFAGAVAIYYGDVIMEYFKIFTVGLGILEGQAAHSSDERMDGFLKVLRIFFENPIVGVSLGGIDPHIAFHTGIAYSTEDNGMGMCTFAEVLAASGIFGFLIFITYFIQLFMKSWKLSLTMPTKEFYLLRGMLWALLFEIIILQFNQNILRSYFWMHIAVLTTLFVSYKKSRMLNL